MNKLVKGRLIEHRILKWGVGIILETRDKASRDPDTGEVSRFYTQYRVWFPKITFDLSDPNDRGRRWWFDASNFMGLP